jgi:hypothetical protein
LPVASSAETSGGGAFLGSDFVSFGFAAFSALGASPEKTTTRMRSSATPPPAIPRIRGRLFFAGAAGPGHGARRA